MKPMPASTTTLPRQRRGRMGALLAVIVMTSACTIGGDDSVGPSGVRLDEWRGGGWRDWSTGTWPRDPGSLWKGMDGCGASCS